ncbi:hypothetical protein K491DRAFT_683256 [Lophiostoma macrostomum CBS 122681]|uniref:Uncharacterized protein n=1 Tax=Lophiostoma macrostomum CBS 122681 TaxID=1314788 RepID=A0A6A6SRF4_9PLEO|nr:hypothetical protein K491DRAFT_683256 [Lophiostoma macrostomum CBS 122681]
MTFSNPSGGVTLPPKDSFKVYRDHKRTISSSSEGSNSSCKSTIISCPSFDQVMSDVLNSDVDALHASEIHPYTEEDNGIPWRPDKIGIRFDPYSCQQDNASVGDSSGCLKRCDQNPAECNNIYAPTSTVLPKKIELVQRRAPSPMKPPKTPVIKPQHKVFDPTAFENQNWMTNLSASKIEAADDVDEEPRRGRKAACKPVRPIIEDSIEQGKQDEDIRESQPKLRRLGSPPSLRPSRLRSPHRDDSEYETIQLSDDFEQDFGIRAIDDGDEDEDFETLSRPPSRLGRICSRSPSPVGPTMTFIRHRTESELGVDSSPSTPEVSQHPLDTDSERSDSVLIPYEDSDDENRVGIQGHDDTWHQIPSLERSPKATLTSHHQRYVSSLDHTRGPLRTTSMGNLIESATGDWLHLNKEIDGTLAANKNGASGRSDPHRRKSMMRVVKNWATGSNHPRKETTGDASSEVSSYLASTVKTAPVTKPEKRRIMQAREARRIIREDKARSLAAERSTVFPVRNTVPGRVTREEKDLYAAVKVELVRREMLEAGRSETRLPPREGAEANARERDLKRRAMADIQKQKEGESNQDYLKRNVQNKANLFQAAKDRRF